MADDTPLRYGWTTGACATAAATAAYQAMLTGEFPDPVTISLPGGQNPAFALAWQESAPDYAAAAIVKDAGDDPDVTHGALVRVKVSEGESNSGVTFVAGEGVGTVTLPGLPLPPGEPAINPAPREMISAAIAAVAEKFSGSGDVIVEISIPDGERMAERTMNSRLGIKGGLSVLGTTGIVVPYSCAAWISSIHQGIDVARAAGITHVAGATGSTSEAAVAKLYDLPILSMIDMGDFVGGMLKHLRSHPVKRVTIAGGFAKLTKLGQGLLDLHSKRGSVDFEWLAKVARDAGAEDSLVEAILGANTGLHVLELCRQQDFPIGDSVAAAAQSVAAAQVEGAGIQVDVAVFDREGHLVGQS
jgi:cobalt-precorrin-5B (C1)-methyltransferase